MKATHLAVFAVCAIAGGMTGALFGGGALRPAFADNAQRQDLIANSLFPTSTYGRMPRDFSGIIWGGVPPLPAATKVTERGLPPAPGWAFAPQDKAQWIDLLQPWVKEMLTRYEAVYKGNHTPLDPQSTCHPFELPGKYAQEGGAEIQFLISPKIILMDHEDGNDIRIIYMDQEHPKNVKPTWLGHSVGKWDGDTLVIDTIGYNDIFGGRPMVVHSKQLHTVERIRLIDVGRKLEYKFTYEDPGAYVKPYTNTYVYLPARDQGSPIPERSCERESDTPVPMASDKTASKG